MLREADSLAVSTHALPHSTFIVAPMATNTPTRHVAAAETAEEEIARLTWSVLDGSAALNDRRRLAELVNAQHSRRHRALSLP
jgi:hypothetical protein